jgi:hypothetical protein
MAQRPDPGRCTTPPSSSDGGRQQAWCMEAAAALHSNRRHVVRTGDVVVARQAAFQTRWWLACRCSGGLLYFFSFVCRACQSEAHDKGLVVCRASRSWRTTKSVGRGLPSRVVSFFCYSATRDAQQSVFTVRDPRRRAAIEFYRAKICLRYLPCALVENARQRFCHAFLSLCHPSIPVVVRRLGPTLY